MAWQSMFALHYPPSCSRPLVWVKFICSSLIHFWHVLSCSSSADPPPSRLYFHPPPLCLKGFMPGGKIKYPHQHAHTSTSFLLSCYRKLHVPEERHSDAWHMSLPAISLKHTPQPIYPPLLVRLIPRMKLHVIVIMPLLQIWMMSRTIPKKMELWHLHTMLSSCDDGHIYYL